MMDEPEPPPLPGEFEIVPATPRFIPKTRIPRRSPSSIGIWIAVMAAGLAVIALALFTFGESSDSRAIREWWRQEHGDGAPPMKIVTVKRRGAPSQFLVKHITEDEFRQCRESPDCVCVPVKWSALNGFGMWTEADNLFVIRNGKVKTIYWSYKRR